MKKDWMLAVLEDLRLFADLNGMQQLSHELARVAIVARSEIGRATASVSHDGVQHDGLGGQLSRRLGEGENA